jgi:hypothetical protein
MENAAATSGSTPIKAKLNADQIPVRRGFWDWLLMRSQATVRKRMFGPSEAPSLPVTAVMKAKRIVQAGREAIDNVTAEQFKVLMNTDSTGLPTELVGNFVAKFSGPMKDAISACQQAATEKLAELDTRLADVQNILAGFTTLGEHVDKTAAAVEGMKDRFGFEDITLSPANDQVDVDIEADDQNDEDVDGCYSSDATEAIDDTTDETTDETTDQDIETIQTDDEEGYLYG